MLIVSLRLIFCCIYLFCYRNGYMYFCSFNWIIIKPMRQRAVLISFHWKKDLRCFLAGIKIKRHFPLMSPFTYFFQIRVNLFLASLPFLTFEKTMCRGQIFYLLIKFLNVKCFFPATPSHFWSSNHIDLKA